MKKYDFSGYATVNDLKCSDGRIIRRDAFMHNHDKKVPLVWNHMHDNPERVLGHAVLENRENGVYARCSFNDTSAGKHAKASVAHGDIVSLSIYANKLKQSGASVIHGDIREVSLVIAGANPSARIDNVMYDAGSLDHSDDPNAEMQYEAIIHAAQPIILEHSEKEQSKPVEKTEEGEKEMSKEKTIKDVIDTMNEEQKNAMYAMVGLAVEQAEGNDDDDDMEHGYYDEGDYMKHNAFQGNEYSGGDSLSHSDVEAIFSDANARRYGTLKETVLAHNIDNIDYLFPDSKLLGGVSLITRKMEWVGEFMSSVGRSPFSRVRTIHADLTEDEARAKGYIKGNLKKEQVFSLLKRETVPTTIYKKQKVHRDDLTEITDFNAVALIKQEMRFMLEEEIAKAALMGDGRTADNDDKISELNIRPIWKDSDLYAIKYEVAVKSLPSDQASELIDSTVRARKNYRGAGNPIFFTTEDNLTEMLLIKDTLGHRIYKSEADVAIALRARKIVTVPVMEGAVRVDGADNYHLQGIMVNLADYNIGTDKLGAVSMFEDFDIDYNAQKYLIETRCSGALVTPYSAIVLETKTTG